MKLLLTGATGQLGRALLASIPAGVEVIALTRADLDLADGRAIEARIAADAPDLIINAAAYTAVDAAEGDADAAYLINRDAPATLAKAAAACGARFVHISTDFVFDGRASTPYPPEHSPAPIGIYGASKAAGEAAVMAALPDALIVRTAWLYAAAGGNFVLTMLRLMADHPDVRVVADQVGAPTHAVSLADAIRNLIAAGASGIHHFTDAGSTSRYDFAVAIQEEALALGLLDRPVPILPITSDAYPTAARRPAYSVLDTSATDALLGGPARPWRAQLRLALGEMRRAHG